jgi:hypothetical protein
VPFRHPDRSADLVARIEFEVRERVEEAVDYVCLDALVRSRRARGLAPPSADNADDKRAYTANVLAFLERLRSEVATDLTADAQRKIDQAAARAPDRQAQLVAAQVALAQLLPDYWQRFEAVSARYRETEPAELGSSGEGRGLLGRLFGLR